MAKHTFKVPNVRSFYNEVEQPTLEYWKTNSIFEKSISERSDDNHFVFYDGPPFVTGLPHYGHLLASVLKDIVPRFQTMKGKKVERLWGWDCHGIPIEEMVERKFETKNRREIESRIGIKEFTDACATYVTDVSGEWEWYIDRIARWVDMKKPYRTMDLPYMETVMWVFKQFYEKGLVYKGKRVSLYCTRCGTPLSNFEIAMDNSYADLEDPSVYVKFPAKYHKTGVGAGVVIENEKGEVLMIRRVGKDRDQVWGIVGGKYEEQDNESLLNTVAREVKEEINCDIDTASYYGFSVDVFEGRLFKTHHFKVTVKGEPKVVDTEGDLDSELHWISKNAIPWDNMHIPTRNCLKDVLNGKISDEQPSIEKPDVFIMAWTTTPWTLPANTALVVDKDEDYVTVKVANEYFILGAKRAEEVLKETEYTVVDSYKGKEVVGITYTPLFDYFPAGEKDFRVYPADFVSMEDGTGIIHMAPGFGEDDTALGKAIGLSMHETIDDEGKIIPAVKDYAGQYFKKADPFISADLTKRGLMFKEGRITHSYPICYRCKTPLVYKAQDAWYVDIQQVKPQLFKNNEPINWVPEHIKEGRFNDAIKTFPDWGLSRTRYWATPMPIWECDKCEHREVLGSIAEIEAKSGKKITNLHRPYIDEHTYACEKCNDGTMRRVAEVVDCWLESASMPFAQFHYPFENKEKFEKNFPGDFITEYVGQTRAWFNVMHVVSTILFGSNAFKNVICTGVIKGNDGRKMSKSLKNYPDPKGVIEKYGGDAFRVYIAGSVLPTGEDLNVSEEAIAAPVKDVLLPFMNVYKYFALYANQHQFEFDPKHVSTNTLDQWVLARVKKAGMIIDTQISAYLLPKAIAEIKPLIDDVSTWYIRRSRDRFVAGDNDALQTLFAVIVTMTKLFAPIMPFVTEFVYQELKDNLPPEEAHESVHLAFYPHIDELTSEESTLIDTMELARSVASLAQSIRIEKGFALKQPLAKLFYHGDRILAQEFLEIIADELNVQTVEAVEKIEEAANIATKVVDKVSVGLDTEITEELAQLGMLREILRAVQSARKQANLSIGEEAIVILASKDSSIVVTAEKYAEKIKTTTFVKSLSITTDLTETPTITAQIGAEKSDLQVTVANTN
jgi:isoleucyl-tRNA synthetase